MKVGKQRVLRLLGALPEEIDVEELRYRLYLLVEIQAGEEDIAAGRRMSHDEARRRAAEWLRR